MAEIIRQDFTVEDFNKMVQEFLFSDTRVSLPMQSLTSLKELLIKTSPAFQKMFQSYFAKKDNRRYDDLTSRMVAFIKKIVKYNAELNDEERRVFTLFWLDVAETIESDYLRLHDQYLANCCNYFIYEIRDMELMIK